jgi:hypothetical protein
MHMSRIVEARIFTDERSSPPQTSKTPPAAPAASTSATRSRRRRRIDRISASRAPVRWTYSRLATRAPERYVTCTRT